MSSLAPEGIRDCYIQYLPEEITTEIFSYLNTKDLLSCIKTCTRWRQVINSNERIWRRLCLSLTESVANVAADRQNGLTWKVSATFYVKMKNASCS